MMASGPSRSLFHRKPLESVASSAERHGFKRVLGPVDLVLLGVGGVVGSGVYVMTGAAAARFAGPAVLVSLLIAGAACVLIALCYAELSSAAPASGAAYSYCYATLGEVMAWIVGWLVLMDFGLAGSSLAVAWSAYLASLFHSFGVDLPAALVTPTFQAGAGGAIVGGHSVNLVAALTYAAVMGVLIAGISESRAVNAVLVTIKVAVLVAFIALGARAVHPANWHPFVPANEGGFTYGWPGVARGASMLFFAYLGFEIVSNAAAETRNPQKDLPKGVLGALGACTAIYLLVAIVMTGILPFKRLGAPDALAVAADLIGYPWLAILIKFGALIGISSVLLVNAYGQSRLAFAVSADGLLPPLFSTLHRTRRTPHIGIVVLGLASAAMAATLPLSLLTDMVSLGVAFCFSVVAISVMWLRTTAPDLPRPFRVPFGGFRIRGVWIGVIPLAAMLICWALMVPTILDISHKASTGDAFPAIFMGSYFAAGAVIYCLYGRRRSRVGPGAAVAEPLSASAP
jgi:APA family basic amino acid/polyamine antiporter